MSALVAVVILVAASALAVVLAMPLIVWLRRRRARVPRSSGMGSADATLLDVAPGLLVVVMLLVGFASEYLAPDSWLGQRMAQRDGKFWFFLLVMIPVCLLELAWMPVLKSWRERIRSRTRRRP
jgi:hypothetical protein